MAWAPFFDRFDAFNPCVRNLPMAPAMGGFSDTTPSSVKSVNVIISPYAFRRGLHPHVVIPIRSNNACLSCHGLV
jgi:hypothetical protein